MYDTVKLVYETIIYHNIFFKMQASKVGINPKVKISVLIILKCFNRDT